MPPRRHVLIVEARFYDDIADALVEGASAVLEAEAATYDRVAVPGALEIPAAIGLAADSGEFDAFVALGCVIRGETSHYDIVSNESARGLQGLALTRRLAIGNGILTVDTRAQAVARANPGGKDKGGDAARAALSVLALKERWPDG